MTTSPTPASMESADERIDLAKIRERAEKAWSELKRVAGVSEYWGKRGEPRLSIPADSNRDTDLLIGESLMDVEKLCARISTLEAEVKALREAVQIAESIMPWGAAKGQWMETNAVKAALSPNPAQPEQGAGQ